VRSRRLRFPSGFHRRCALASPEQRLSQGDASRWARAAGSPSRRRRRCRVPGLRACWMIRWRLLTNRSVCSAARSCALVRQNARIPASTRASRSPGRRWIASSFISTTHPRAPTSRSQRSSSIRCAVCSP
jgi:hypothetical protein